MGCPGFNVSVLKVASSATKRGLFVILQNSFLNSVSAVNHADYIEVGNALNRMSAGPYN